MNKKGISALLETVLLILVVLAAAGIIFGAVIPMLRGPIEKATACSDAIVIAAVSQNEVTLTIKKEITLASIAVNVFNATESVAAKSYYKADLPVNIGETKSLALPPITGAKTKVRLIPVIVIEGRNETCPAVESVI